MKKRILSIVLSIVMLVSLLPTTAGAVSNQKAYVGGAAMYVDDSTVTYYTNGATEAVTNAPADWNARYEPTSNTLTIRNLSVTGTSGQNNGAGICLSSGAMATPVFLVIEGANSVTGADTEASGDNSVGIYTDTRDLTISGSGTLSVTGGDATGTGSSIGIWCDALTISDDDIVINAAGGSVESGSWYGSCGIYAGGGGGMNISAGIVNATGDSIGISCNGGTTNISGGVVNASAVGTSNGMSYGISARTVEISGGTVNAIGGTPASDESSVGFYGSKNITISGGVINATGGDASAANTSAGIEAADTLTVIDGVLNATGGSAKTISAGIGGDANGNAVNISDGVVVATGGSAGHTSFGHYGSNGSCSIQMSGGVLVARAGAGTNGSVALCEAPELNGARIAGQVVSGSFAGSPAEFNENATAVAIVPSGYTVQNTKLTNGNAADYTIATATAVVVNDSTPLSLTAAGSAVTLNGDLVLINLQYETQVPAFYLGTDVTVSGSGTLTAIGAANKEWSYGVAGTGSDLSVNGAKIIAIGGPASKNSYGIGASVNVNVSNNGSVIAIGGGMTADDANSYGIGAGSVSVSGTGEITAVAGMGKTSAGINGKLNAGDTATVTAVGGVSTQAYGNSCGIYGATTVQGSATVNALGGAAINSNSTSFGISGAVTVGGGTVNAVGNTAKMYSYGIGGLGDGAISITAGTVNAVGGIAGETSFGIQSGKSVSIAAGSAVNAVGRTYGLRTASGTLAGGNFTGGSKAVSISDNTSNVNALLADGCGYFAGSTQLTPGNSDSTVGDPYQVVTVKEIPIPHVHPVCGAEHTNIGDHTSECGDITWTALSTVLTYDSESDTYKGALSSGNYYLDKDMTVKGTRSNNNDFCIDIQGTAETPAHVNICLNGHQLKGSSGDVILHVSGGTDSNNASLSICDCYDAATHTGAEYTHTYTSPISGEEKTVIGGLVTGAVGGYARTMYANCAQVNIYGGTFAGNGSGKTGGGALYMSGAVLRFYDGSITDNYVSSGGMLSMQNAEAHLIGGSVTGNAAYYGVTGNYEDDGVGGVHLFGESTAAIHSGFDISGNFAGLKDGEQIDSNLLLGVKPTDNSDLYITLTGPRDTPIGIRTYEPGVFTSGFGSTNGVNLDDFVSEKKGYFLTTEGQGSAAEVKLEPYAITTQPTADSLKVTTNKADDVVAYSWHSQASSVVNEQTAIALSGSTCTDGVWSGTPQGSSSDITFFEMELNAGDTLTATLTNNDSFYRIVLGSVSSGQTSINKNNAIDGTTYVFEISATDEYHLWVGDTDGDTPTFSVVRSSVGPALAGQTTATLTDGTGGKTYVCKVTFEDGTVLVSDPVEYEAPVHNHSWTYSGSGNTITATCGGAGICDATNTTLTLEAPSSFRYDGAPKEASFADNKTSIGGVDTLPAIMYQQTATSYPYNPIGDPTETPPTGAGRFVASVTVEGQKASVVYSIEKLDRENIKQFTVSDITYNSFVINLHEDDWSKTDFVCQVGGDYIDFTPDTSGKATITVPEAYAGHSNLLVHVCQKETDTYKKSDGKDATVSLLPADPTTYTVTVTNDGNGTASASPTSGAEGTEITLTTTPDSGYQLKEWQVVSGVITVTDNKFTMPASNVEIVAVFEVNTFTVSGTVQDNEMGTATVKLMQGNSVIKTTTASLTGSDSTYTGTYSFTDVAPGVYNIVVTKGDVTMTVLVTITDANVTVGTITMPDGKVNSKLEVKDEGGVETPDVVVDGLQKEAKAVKDANGAATEVTVTMTVQAEAVSASDQEQTAIKNAAPSGATIEYLDITVKKTVVGGSNAGTSNISETRSVLEIVVPYDFSDKENVTVYRKHLSEAAAPLSKLNSEPGSPADGTFLLDEQNGRIHIYASKFSTYAIGYTNSGSSQPIQPPTTGGGGGYTPTYAITVEDAVNGEVKANRSYASSGSIVTITATPEDGYVLGKLTVKDDQGNNIEVTDKGDGTYTFKMPNRKVTVEASFAADGSYSTCPGDHTCPIWPYTDAEATAWYHDGVHYCIENGLMSGYGNGIFKPNADTTRAMITVMLWRLNGSPVVNYLLDFEDVKAEAWYTEAIRWAKSEGIIGGYGNGCWGPGDAVTREQMVTILWRYAQYKGYDVSVGENTNILSYDDAFDVAEYAIPAMQWACGSGMVQGMNDPDGEGMILAPESKGTRAQIATMIMRFCEEILK